jgi:hypothetical protein
MKYKKAPLLIDNDGNSDFPYLRIYIENANRKGNCPSLVSTFSSKFRSCRQPLDVKIANQLIKVFEKTASGSHNIFAQTYFDALPYPPPNIDENRKHTYFECIKKAENNKTCK